MKRVHLIYLMFLLVFIVYGFSLSFIDIDPSSFLMSISSGYFLLGLLLGVVFRRSFLSGAVAAFPLTFMSWLIAFALFSSSSGITMAKAFSEGFQNILTAGLVFSSITFVAALLPALVFRLFQLASKRRKRLVEPNTKHKP